MRKFYDLPIRSKLLLVTLMTSGPVILLACAVLFFFQTARFRRGFAAEIESLGAVMAYSSSEPLMLADKNSATELLAALRVKPQITCAAIYDNNSALFARYGTEAPPPNLTAAEPAAGVCFANGRATLEFSIADKGTRLGSLYLQARFEDEYNRLLELHAKVLAGVLAGSFALVLLLSSFLHRLISQPIKALAHAAKAIADKEDYSVRAQPGGKDELGLFTQTFNRMLDCIQTREKVLRQVNSELNQEITERRRIESAAEKLNRQLVLASRHAGMAEVATGVLHNVGNVLNSINVSLNLIGENLRRSELPSLIKAAALMEEHEANLTEFFSAHPKGKRVPSFIISVAGQLHRESDALRLEHQLVVKNVEHLKQIVAMQQNYARVSGTSEKVSIAQLLDDAIEMNWAGLLRHDIQVHREYSEVPPIIVDRHQVLQILVNLIHNAKYALDAAGHPDRQLTLGVSNGGEHVKIWVRDNGIGIPGENLTRIFSHGFTTRKDGHGFGLHSGANAAKEMGGLLKVESEGVGKGATFILELPLATTTSPGNTRFWQSALPRHSNGQPVIISEENTEPL